MDSARAKPVSVYVVFAGLFTVSWSRFANTEVATFNLRLPVLLFAVALVLTSVDLLRQRGRERYPLAARWALVLLLAYLAAVLVAGDTRTAIAQWLTVLLGAFVPFQAIVNASRLGTNWEDALTWFIRGGVFAAVFGLYQLTAFYTGLPQLVKYTDTSGGFGRISAFSYEAAYFGYFLVLVIAAVLARGVATGTRVSVPLMTFLLLVLVLANSRATLLTVPVFLILLWLRAPSTAVRRRLVVSAIIVVWGALVVFLVVPSLAAGLATRVTGLFDPTEVSSNAPRLALYNACLRIIAEHPLVGIGPGQLIQWLPSVGYLPPSDSTPNSVIANNAWLQAALDGGVVLLIVQVVFAVVLVVQGYRSQRPGARLLAMGWLTVLLVAGALTSFYFDATLWTTAGMLAAVSTGRRENEYRIARGEPHVVG